MQCKCNPFTHSRYFYPFISIELVFHSKTKQPSKFFPMKKTKTTTTTTTTLKKKMTTLRPPQGFFCQSTAATAVCKPTAMASSVILPRKIADHHHRHHYMTSINKSVKYSRLVDHDSKFRLVSTSVSENNHKKLSIRQHLQLDQEEQHPKSKHPTSSSNVQQVFQVVVMRVSIHCQGCAGKLKKHLSKMEGVTSYSIDLETKRVTVMGHVSPNRVLESISKVKKAEFWPN